MDINYEIVRSKRRTVGITVKEGRVTVRAPFGICEKEISAIVEKHSLWIERKIREQKHREEIKLSGEEEEVLCRIAQKYLSEMIEYYSSITGLVPKRVRISRARKRFGSCSDKGSVSLSFYVMLYPRAARELVLIHELCHLRYMDHSKDFYELLSGFLPDHRERKKLLSGEYMRSFEDVKEEFKEYL